MRILEKLINLFYPILCIGCYSKLLFQETIICVKCQHNLPFLNINKPENNSIISRFYGRIPIDKASGFLYFNKYGITQKIIHELKYKNNEEIGNYFGNWYGKELLNQNFFKGIDYIIPVPLHPEKFKNRGYNQLTKFGETLSLISGITYIPNILLRTSASKTQTLKNRIERYFNTKNPFLLTDKEIFKNKHVLIIDDVITTGATLEMCCEELLKTKNLKISIVTLSSAELT